MARITGVASKLQNISELRNAVGSVVDRKTGSKLIQNKVHPSVQSVPMQNREHKRLPLKEVVADCEKRWFQETLKEAKNGDTQSQFLVAQMYFSGYGIPKDDRKGHAWFRKAQKFQSPIPSILSKQPGFKASESSSDEKSGAR
eukprot:TRINITY_DN28285_c0_g1_i1.p1 TRINITY_DN28285_c0_g1~~TRINITY_DN28285_c0_g1_i1.p1  ORF type:complete len:143 (+),score=33.54 TRINITY_DN28285_c0_g1_i1:110-538(+)